jgi:hypothetical protein
VVVSGCGENQRPRQIDGAAGDGVADEWERQRDHLVAFDAVAIEDRGFVGLAVPMLVVASGRLARSDLGDRLRRRSLGEMQRERAQYIWACERAAEACGETGDAAAAP